MVPKQPSIIRSRLRLLEVSFNDSRCRIVRIPYLLPRRYHLSPIRNTLVALDDSHIVAINLPRTRTVYPLKGTFYACASGGGLGS
jgi:hypothetical protein